MCVGSIQYEGILPHEVLKHFELQIYKDFELIKSLCIMFMLN